MSRRQGTSCFISTLLIFTLLTLATSADSFAQRRRPRRHSAPMLSDQPSAVLDRALRLYDSKDYYMSSIEFFKVVGGDTGDSTANRQKAEFWMGKTLYKLKFFAASLTYFDRIVQKGSAHAHYNETLKWLASLSREVTDASGVIEKIGKYNRTELDMPALEAVRDELYFLLGKYHYGKGSLKEAVDLFNAVNPKSEFYVQAKLFEGAVYVRQYEARPAVEAFKEVLRVAAASKDPKVRPFADLANLSLARTFYSTGQYDLAVKYFDRVSTESYDFPNSLFEVSWANFMLKQAGYSKALGNIHTLQAPFFEHFVKPESVAEAQTVKATIYFYNCDYNRAAATIVDFNENVPVLAQELKKLLDANPTSDAFYEASARIRDGKSSLPDNVVQAARAGLSDLSLMRRFGFIKELDREMMQIEQADPSWKSTRVASEVLTDITLQRSLAVNETGELARQRIGRLISELAQLVKRVIKIEYEILQGQKGVLEEEVKTEQQLLGAGKAMEIGNVRVDDEHEFWPFTGEWWRDELGYYRFRLLNRCEKLAPEGAPSGPTEGP